MTAPATPASPPSRGRSTEHVTRRDGRRSASDGDSAGSPKVPPAAGRAERRSSGRSDDRPYVLILLALLVVIGAMALGPVRSLGEANDRVDQLTEQRDVLAADVERLEGERDDLNDPAEQEVYAREQLGLVRPGEQPYIVLPGDPAVPGGADAAAGEAATAGDDDAQEPRRSWFRRIADALGSLFGG